MPNNRRKLVIALAAAVPLLLATSYRDDKTLTLLRTLLGAGDAYHAAHGQFPSDGRLDLASEYLRGGIPTDSWGQPFVYRNPASLGGEESYDLFRW